MDNVINTALVFLYVLALIFSIKKPLAPLVGLIAIVLMNVVSVYMVEHKDVLVSTFGSGGYAYRWQSSMACISLLWFICIQNSDKPAVIVPVGLLLVLDITSMMLSEVNTSNIDPYIAAANVLCHLTYMWGCVGGVSTNYVTHNRTDKSCGKSNRGHKQ
jgi:hypothetical protein